MFKSKLKSRIAALVTAVVLCLNIAVITTSAQNTVEIDTMIAFGDSIVNGYAYECGKGLTSNIWSDYFGNRKFSSLLASEYNLPEANYFASGQTSERWYENKAVAGAKIGNTEYWTNLKSSYHTIYENQILTYDTEKIKNADVIILDGGINNCAEAVGFEHYKASAGTARLPGETKAVSSMSLTEARAFVEKYKAMTSEEVAEYVSTNSRRAETNTWDFYRNMQIEYLRKIVSYVEEQGFTGKIYAVDNINPYSDGNESLCYLWDSVIDYCISEPMEIVAEESDCFEFVPLLETIRTGSKVLSADKLHLTFLGNQEVYKKISLAIDSSGTNLIEFDDNTIPQNAEWKSIFDFESFSSGSSVNGITGGSVIDYQTVLTNNASLTSSPATDENKMAYVGDNNGFYIDLSQYKNKIYGIKMSMYTPADRGYIELNIGDGGNRDMVRKYSYYTNASWTESKVVVGDWAMEKNPNFTSNNKNIYTQVDGSDFSNVDTISFSTMNGVKKVYIDNVQILTTADIIQPNTSVSAVNTTASASTVAGPTTTTAPTTSSVTTSTVEGPTTTTAPTTSSVVTSTVSGPTTTTATTTSSVTTSTVAGPTTTVAPETSTVVATTTLVATTTVAPTTTTKIETTATTSVATTTLPSTIIYGDANEDGKINMADVLILRKYLAKWNVSPNLANADCNADTKINMADVLLLRKYLAKWDVTLGK